MEITIDIETGPSERVNEFLPTRDEVKYGNTKDEEKREARYQEECQKVVEKAALNAITGKVLLVGIKFGPDKIKLFSGGDESSLLRWIWDELGLNSGFFIGHNIKSFDFPFLIRRSMILGVNIDRNIINCLLQYHSPKFFDTMLEWQLGNRQEYTSLETLTKAFNLPQYTGPVTGAEFYKWWDKDKEACKEYCRHDVESTYQIYKRMTA